MDLNPLPETDVPNADDPVKTDQNRRYLKRALGKAAHRGRSRQRIAAVSNLLQQP